MYVIKIIIIIIIIIIPNNNDNETRNILSKIQRSATRTVCGATPFKISFVSKGRNFEIRVRRGEVRGRGEYFADVRATKQENAMHIFVIRTAKSCRHSKLMKK